MHRTSTYRLRRPSRAILASLLSYLMLVALFPPMSAAATFSNPAAINTTDPPCGGAVGPATLYPSVINVSGQTGTVADVNVTLQGMNFFEGDFEVLLVGPAGGAQNLVLLSDSGSVDVSNLHAHLRRRGGFRAAAERLVGYVAPHRQADGLRGADGHGLLPGAGLQSHQQAGAHRQLHSGVGVQRGVTQRELGLVRGRRRL